MPMNDGRESLLAPLLSSHSLGLLTISVYSALSGPGDIASNVAINVYVAFGDDLKLAFPGVVNNTIIVKHPLADARFTPEMDSESTTVTGETEMKFEAAPVVSNSTPPPQTQGTIMSIKSLSTRAYVVGGFPPADHDRAAWIPSSAFLLNMSQTHGDLEVSTSGFARWAQMYRVWYGSVILNVEGEGEYSIGYRARPNGVADLEDTVYSNTGDQHANSGPLQNVTASTFYNSVIGPFRSPYRMALVPTTIANLDVLSHAPGGFEIFVKGGTVSNRLIISMSGGDNFRLGIPYRIPAMVCLSENVSSDDWPSDGTVVQLPTEITINNVPGNFPFNTGSEPFHSLASSSFTWTAPALSTNWAIDSVTLQTSDLSDRVLRAIGYKIPDGATRQINPGTSNFQLDLSAYRLGPGVMQVSFNRFEAKIRHPFPVRCALFNPTTVHHFTSGTLATFYADAWADSGWLASYIGIPDSKIAIPLTGVTAQLSTNLPQIQIATTKYGHITTAFQGHPAGILVSTVQ